MLAFPIFRRSGWGLGREVELAEYRRRVAEWRPMAGLQTLANADPESGGQGVGQSVKMKIPVQVFIRNRRLIELYLLSSVFSRFTTHLPRL